MEREHDNDVMIASFASSLLFALESDAEANREVTVSLPSQLLVWWLEAHDQITYSALPLCLVSLKQCDSSQPPWQPPELPSSAGFYCTEPWRCLK